MKRIIVTVGPPFFRNVRLKDIHEDYYIYRINGAHGEVKDITHMVGLIRQELPEAEVLIDLPGNKIRTTGLDKPIAVKVGQKFTLTTSQVNYTAFYEYLKVGDTILSSDSTLKFKVESFDAKEIKLSSLSEGQLLNHKGLHIKDMSQNMPFLFQKDKELIKLANQLRIKYLGLSFVRTADDIKQAKELIDKNITIISKVETKAAVDNLDDILREVEFILIDRGDLSTDIGLEKVPSFQRFIIEKAHFRDKKVFLSTQFLKNMEDKPVPTIAEIIDLYNTFKMGIYGIQLSEETAVGKYPVECLNVIKRVLREIDIEKHA
jgi:pyruvate kinase